MELTVKNISKFMKYGVFGQRPVLPLFLIVNLTTRCNMACRHCSDDVWGDSKDDHSLEMIEKFSAELGKVERIGLTGGEPFLRKDLVEICQVFAKNNQVDTIFIPTNGFDTDTTISTVRSVLKTCPDVNFSIMLSLDGFEETHDFLRKEGSFKKVIETARQLKEMSSEFPKLSLDNFNSTINNRNWRELPELAKFIRKEFNTDLTFNLLFGTPRDNTLELPGKDDLEQTIKQILGEDKKTSISGLINRAYKDILIQANFENKQPVPCRAGSLIGQVYANGDVHVCPVLPPLGNLRTRSFNDIWHGKEAKGQLLSIKRGECVCNNVCYLRLSMTSYWKLPFLMLKALFS